MSEDTIRLEDLEQFGFRSFNEILPLLETLEDADLATRNELGYTTEFKPINTDRPFGDFPETESIEP